MSKSSDFNIDPADNDERLLKRMGLPGSGRSTDALPDVFDRLGELTRKATTMSPDDVPKLSEPVLVEGVAADGNVVVTMNDAKVTGIEIAESWLRSKPNRQIVEALVQATNEAITKANEAAMAQLTAVNSSFGDLMRNVSELQSDIHRAYLNDMHRVTAPLRYEG